MDPQAEQALKKQFAAELLKTPDNPYVAANKLTNGNFGQAAHMVDNWQTDEVVIAEMARLREELGEMAFLPDKVEMCREIWKRAQSCFDPDAYQKLMKLYAETRGFIEKPAAVQVNQTNIQQPRVMIMRDHGDDKNWETRVAKQQRELIESNATRH